MDKSLRGVAGLFGIFLFSPIIGLGQARAPAQLPPAAVAQIEAIQAEKASWTPVQRKIDSNLLLAMKRRLGRPIAAGVPGLRMSVDIDSRGLALVDVKASVTDALLARIQALGGTVISGFPQYDAIRARVPLAQVETLAGEEGVRFVRPADLAITNKVNTSEGDMRHRADLARSSLGVNGSGVKIGVLSDGVSSRKRLERLGDLPTITVLSGQAGSGDEGCAMLEIVYDLAPGASLYFATALGGEAQFAQNIRNLKAAGCKVIVDDVFYFAEPVFQDGIIAQAVEEVVGQDVAYFSSAGNSGNLNEDTAGVWEGDFQPIAAPPVVGGTAHDFGGGKNFNEMTKDPPYYIILQWSDPWGQSANDYDLYLLDPSRTTVFDASVNTQTGTQDPLEWIDSVSWNDLGNTLVILKKSGAARYLHLNTHRGKLAVATTGQTCGHAAAKNGFGVAAVDQHLDPDVFDGNEPVETFSSDGPRRVFFEADGTPITPGNYSSTGGELRLKPDLTAADGVAVATPGFNPFYGTSAAAPHAAAIAALAIQKGYTTPSQIRQVLSSTAIDIEAPGVDRDSGYGVVDAYAALDSPPEPRPDPLERHPTQSLKVSVSALLSNDLDPNGYPLSIIDVTSSDTGSSVERSGDWIFYDPAPSAIGNDWFTYTVSNGHGKTARGTVTVDGVVDGAQSQNRVSIEDLGGGIFRITFNGIPGRQYTIEFTTSLSEPISWTKLGTATADALGVLTFEDTAGSTSRFYRTAVYGDE